MTLSPTPRERMPVAALPTPRARRAVLGIAFLAAVAAAQPAAAQQTDVCANGRVGHVDVTNNSLFRPSDIRGKRFSWAMGLANALHIRTREDYVRNQMQLHEGECYDAETLDASVRFLRQLDFIARAQANATQQPDSTWTIAVETWDEWSTSGGVYFDVEGAFQFQGFYVTEINALGRGLRLAFRRRDFRERDDKSLTLSFTRFLGTPTQANVSAGTTLLGSYFRQEFNRPLRSETSRVSYFTRIGYEDRQQSFITGNEQGFSHLLYPMTDKTLALIGRLRFGRPGHLKVVGAEVTGLRRTFPTAPREVLKGDFQHAVTASDSLAAHLAPQASPHSYVALGAVGGLRRVTFTTGRGLDLVSGVQTVALGTELTGSIGRTLTTWGTSSTDTYGWLDGFASKVAGPLLFNLTAHADGRFLDYGTVGRSRWRDLHLYGRALLYLQPGVTTENAVSIQTLLTGVRFDLVSNTEQPYQKVLGGGGGNRGFRNDQIPTGSAATFFVEERLNLPWFRPAADLGLTGFVDYSRGWADNIPFGQNTGWMTDVGGGLRIGFPAGSHLITHIELGVPVGATGRGHQPVLRTYFARVDTNR